MSSYSFPSGHAIAATLFYGFVAAMVVHGIRGWRWRVLTILLAAFLVLLIDFSRLYLGAHYLSDVLAANAAGFAGLVLVLTFVNTWRQARTRIP